MPPLPRAPRMRLRDLARALGVSPATISNAYHHPERLSPARRARILGEAERHGYHPNPTAAGLRRRTTGTVGVLYTDALPWAFIDPPFSMFLQGVAEVTQEARLKLLLSGAAGELAGDLDVVRGAAVDGFIFYAPPERDPRVGACRRRGLPASLADSAYPPGVPHVTIDDEGGAVALLEHLAALGHRRFGVVCLPLHPGAPDGPAPLDAPHGGFRAIGGRLAGYAQAAAAHGLDWEAAARLHAAGVNSVEGGRRAAHALLDTPRPPTALLCLSDQLALGALAAAAERHLSIPRDLSVVGFDDIPEAARSSPPLTTVHQPHAEKGRLAARLLLDALAGRRPGSRRLETRLVVRASSGPAPRRRERD